MKKNMIVTYFVIILILGIAGYIFLSPDFERISPEIEFRDNVYWNAKTPLQIKLTDNEGIKYYSITLGQYNISKQLPKKIKNITVKFMLPKKYQFYQDNKTLKVEVGDYSKWQFFAGNITKKKFNVIIDKKRPFVNIISRSYGIGRGGAALVIFKAKDKNLKENYIIINNSHKFKVFPYKKQFYYISLISWPIKEKTFNAKLFSIDKAKNKTVLPIPFFKKNYRYKTSKITLNKNFLYNKVLEILTDTSQVIPEDFIERFKLMNENLRAENEELLETTTCNFPTTEITSFQITPFHPLRNGAQKAAFGDHRFYYYNNEKVSESWHLGLDLASTKNAPIKASNPGKVVYAKFTGIYGNTLIIYHGLGLFSSYSHCSVFFKNIGDIVKKDDVIAKTGATGAVFGDHLHFAIFIQGVESQPLEWLDKHWLRDNIYNVIKNADLIIK